MVEPQSATVLDALLRELDDQGFSGAPESTANRPSAYPIYGTIDVVALAEAVQNALGDRTSNDDGKTPADLNAANDG